MTTPVNAAAATSTRMLLPSAAIPSLDGLRAIAVGLVFFAHSGLEKIVPGGLGVTIFFVLSGYLITTLMHSEYLLSGTVDLPHFYLRRLLRLMPPLLIVTAAAALLSALKVIDGGFSFGGLLSVAFYYGNYYVIAHDFHGIPAGIGVVWSLAVEEHYYLLFPPLALFLLRKGSARRSALTLSGLCAVILAWRCLLVSQGVPEAHLTMATDTRVDAILVGCLLALAANPLAMPRTAMSDRRQLLVALACGLVLLGSLLYRNELFRLTLRYTLQSLAVAPLIYLAVLRADSRACRWLNSKPMVYLGGVSYTIYLSHQVILFLIERHWPQLGWFATITATALLTLAVAEPMRRWVERPCAALRRRLHKASPRAAAPLHGIGVESV